jgi:signal transduction histidine kinase
MFREQIARQNVITGIEGTWLKKDGTVIHVLESARAVRDDDGKIIYYDGTFEDITERKNAEMALQEIHAQYRQALIQAKAVPFLRYYYQDSYTFMGEEIVKYTGYPADEFRPNLWLTLRQDSTMLGDCSGMDIHSAAEAFRNGKIQHWLADYKIRTRNGEIRWLNDSSVPITDQNGKVIGSLGVLQDITERKHAEEVIKNINRELEQRVIQRTAQLEAANKELEAFSYSVSHDLRAPLRAIDGFAKILLEDYRDKLDDEGQRLFNIIRANAQKMGQLISDLLQFSRAGRKEIFIGPVDLNQIFRELFAELTQNLSDRTIKFNLKRLPKVKGDASLLKVVVTNLLSNAIKYTRHSSVARISVNYQKEADGSFVLRTMGWDLYRYADKLFGVSGLHSEQEFGGTGWIALVQALSINMVDKSGQK